MTRAIINWSLFQKRVDALVEHLTRDEKRTRIGWFGAVYLVHLLWAVPLSRVFCDLWPRSRVLVRVVSVRTMPAGRGGADASIDADVAALSRERLETLVNCSVRGTARPSRARPLRSPRGATTSPSPGPRWASFATCPTRSSTSCSQRTCPS